MYLEVGSESSQQKGWLLFDFLWRHRYFSSWSQDWARSTQTWKLMIGNLNGFEDFTNRINLMNWDCAYFERERTRLLFVPQNILSRFMRSTAVWIWKQRPIFLSGFNRKSSKMIKSTRNTLFLYSKSLSLNPSHKRSKIRGRRII